MSREQTQNNEFQNNRIQGGFFQGDINELRNKVRQMWGKLSDEEIRYCEDQRERFLSIVEKKYGMSREKADKALRDIERQCSQAA